MPLEELKATLRYRKISYRELADVINVQVSTFSNKINNKNGSEFLTSEIIKLSRYLNFTTNDAIRCFFPELLA